MENKVSAILEGLNPAQEAAVKCVKGPVLIVAGAGSGKTRVLTSRIAYMIANGVDPSRILSLTFTKKAATEMMERVSASVGARNARSISMGTFHSVFIRFLRQYADKLGFTSSFTVYDTGDSQSAIKTVIRDIGLTDESYKPKNVLSRISSAKNSLCLPHAYASNAKVAEEDARRKMPKIAEIYARYMDKCRKNNVMDFDDILLYMNILFRDFPEALDEISSRFDYVMVDEYQDTNYSQYLILRKLAQRHGNICVVGDDSQSIYAFRGADVTNILNFSKDYPGYREFRLEQNYRSTRTIVDAANSLIYNNKSRINKICFSKGDEGELIQRYEAVNPDDEARGVAFAIKRRIASDLAQYKDFAILYRTNSQSRSLEQELRRANIPYVIYSGKSFFDRAEVKDLMAYFKLLVNVDDDESFKRIVNKPARAIGETTIAALIAAAQSAGVSLFKAVQTVNLTAFGLKAAAIEKLNRFATMIQKISCSAATTDAYEVAKLIAYESGLYQLYHSDMSIEGQARAANIDELLNNVQSVIDEQHNDYRDDLMAQSDAADIEIAPEDYPVVLLADYLENITLLSSVDMSDDDSEDASNKVTMMTVHSSKGLEFPHVFVTGLEENLFPSGGDLALQREIEEERRLFYVALTRAEKTVTLTHAQTRMRNGRTENNRPSRFLREIDPKFLRNPLNAPPRTSSVASSSRPVSLASSSRPVSVASRTVSVGSSSRPSSSVSSRPLSAVRPGVSASVKNNSVDPNFVPSPVGELRVGQRVEHNRFGKGQIISINGESGKKIAVIRFDDNGEKKILLAYAKIRIL